MTICSDEHEEICPKAFICPMMSRNIAESFDTDNPTLMRIDFYKTLCVGKDCALWVIEMRDGQRYQERCGLIK
jgi:hypothetical protein